jgi:hypothetical protein
LTAIIELYFVFFVRVSSNDECLWQPKQDSLGKPIIVFELVKINGVAWNAGIRDGDQFLAINNKKFTDVFSAQAILNSIPAGHYANYTVLKNGKIFHTKVLVKKLVNIGNVANVLFALMFMLIGSIVLLAKPEGRVQKLFYAMGVTLVLSSTFVFVPFDFSPGSFQNNFFAFSFLAFTLSFGISFFPFIFLAFFCTFPFTIKLF